MKIGKGTRFHAGHADSCPEWEVTRSRGRGVWEASVVAGDEWAGVTKVFTTADIESSIRRAQYFDRAVNDIDAYWDSLKVGEIVHYENRRSEWVRCEVVLDGSGKKVAKPIALVGDWQKFDLPKRNPDGSVSYPYHAKAIIEGKTGRYNVIFERKLAQGSAPAAFGDPRTLDPVDISVPDMTADEQEVARLEQLRQRLQKELQNRDVRHALTTVQRLLLPEFAA